MKAPRLIYDREWVKGALEEFRIAQAKKEKCTKNLIFNKYELSHLAYQAPMSRKEMEALCPTVRPVTVTLYHEQIIEIIKQGFKKA